MVQRIARLVPYPVCEGSRFLNQLRTADMGPTWVHSFPSLHGLLLSLPVVACILVVTVGVEGKVEGLLSQKVLGYYAQRAMLTVRV